MKTNNNIFKIYSLPNFKVLEAEFDNHKYESDDITKIIKKLKKDKGYNLRINPNNNCIVYGDFDKANEEILNSFLQELCKYDDDVEIKDISYTSSKNNTSFHWSIPSTKTNPKNLKYIFKHIPNFQSFRDYIDLSVYSKHWFRLPNQTLEDKNDPHKIINGEMKDFIFDYVEETKYEWDDEKKEEPKEEEIKNKSDIIFNEGKTMYDFIEILLDNLSDEYSDDYEKWTQISFIIHHELNNEGYNLFDAFSKRSEKYDKPKNKSFWDNIKETDNPLTVKSLMKYVKDDNEDDLEFYKNIIKEFIYKTPKQETPKPNKIKSQLFINSLSGLEGDIALHIIDEYLKDEDKNNKFWCVSSEQKTFYYYDNNIWRKDFENLVLYKIITKKYVDELIQYKTGDKKADKEIQNIIAKLNGKLINFKNVLERIAKEICNPEFYDLCDNRKDLLGFNNGVYETITKTFRKGLPTDYITKTVGYDFPIEDKGYRKKIDKFLKRVFPDPELRAYVLHQQAQAISGLKTINDIVYTHTGKGSNGKSIEQSILEKVYGDYYVEVPTSLLTTINKNDANSPNPFYTQLKGVRYCVGNEPSDGAKINDSLIKKIGSKEGIYYRTLFSNDIIKLPIQCQLHIYCNNKLNFSSTDGGLKRRLKVIEYVSMFTDKAHLINKENNIYDVDVELSEKVKDWASDYMKMLLELFNPKFKYIEPKAVVEASGKYVDSNNDVKRFVKEFYEFTNNQDDFVLLSSIKLEYQYNKEYDQSKLKGDFKNSIQTEMNVVFSDSNVTIKKVSYRNVCRGWKKIEIQYENSEDC